jgi:drug/metabolite transporter superfamily protein YnfA
VTALAEILGCYGVFLWLRHGKPVWWAVVAVVSLGIFAWLLSVRQCWTRLCRVRRRVYRGIASLALAD